jgi:glycosyltransferase involved in cell wall biosynthesis
MAALEHGLAIVSTRPHRLPPELREGENITLVSPDDPAALAERIAQLAQDADLRQRLKRGAKELSVAFSWEAIAQQNIQVYQELIGSNRPG